MSNKYYVRETIEVGYDWMSGDMRDRRVSVNLEDSKGTVINGVSFNEGEPEDMVFFRDLNDVYGIRSLVEEVYHLTKKGAEIEFISVVEEDE